MLDALRVECFDELERFVSPISATVDHIPVILNGSPGRATHSVGTARAPWVSEYRETEPYECSTSLCARYQQQSNRRASDSLQGPKISHSGTIVYPYTPDTGMTRANLP